jgi:hypothetical protein
MTGEKDDPILTSRELISYGFCFQGQERWLNNKGMDVRDFVKNGIRMSVLATFDDGHAQKAIKIAKERRSGR